jgi:outer membrane protein assembly factor BamB
MFTCAAIAQQTTAVGSQPTVIGAPSSARQREDPNAPLGLFPAIGLWALPLNNLLQATPAFKNDRGYFPIGDGQIAAYDVRNGTLLWIAPARAQFQPVLGQNLLFTIEPEAIVALHEETGVEAWRVAQTEQLAAPLVCHNGWLIATSASGAVLAFRASDGTLIWRHDLDALVHTSPTVADDHVYVPMVDGRIIALQVETGDQIWEHRLGGSPNDIAATSDMVYAGSTDNHLYALRARDGLIAWRWSTGADVVGRPVVDKRLVYFASFDNVLRALDKNTGNLRWKRPLALRPTRGLVVMGDTLIASGLSASATVLSMKDGTIRGSMAAGEGEELAAPPHVVTGEGLPIVVLVSRDLNQGTMVRTVTRGLEPTVLPMAPLPNPAPPPVAPQTSPVDQSQPANFEPDVVPIAPLPNPVPPPVAPEGDPLDRT